MNQSIVLAAGCFWGVEKLFKSLKGVISTEVGYTGGVTQDPTYQEVCTGKTLHFEAIKVAFNNQEISLREIFKYFFQIHDPTQTDGQHGDIGSQYFSGIFYSDEEQKVLANELINKIDDSQIFKNKIFTKVLPLQKFYLAEEYHQNYLDKNPSGYMCHFFNKTIDLSSI